MSIGLRRRSRWRREVGRRRPGEAGGDQRRPEEAGGRAAD